MQNFILLTIIVCITSCTIKHRNINNDESNSEISTINSKDTISMQLKTEVRNISCNTVRCDSLINCYDQYFKYLYRSIDYSMQIKILECALSLAENNDNHAHKLLMDYYGSPYIEKDGGTFDWAKRLRGEDAFEITLEYMRKSKGENPGVGAHRAFSIFYSTLSRMLVFKDGSSAFDFFISQKLYLVPDKEDMEIENWLTTDFIDILKNEIKEGRVVFKKYGE